MDVEIDKLEIKAGSEEASGNTSTHGNTHSDADLQLMIEKCVERMLRQFMK